MSRSVRDSTLAALAVLVLLAAACAPAASGPAPAAPAPVAAVAPAPAAASGTGTPLLQQMINGAQREPPFRGQWSPNILGGAAGLNTLIAGMNRKYGLNVQAQFTPGRDMNAMAEVLAQELAAGQPASSDAYMGHGPGMLIAMKHGLLVPLDWNALLDRPIPVDPAFDPYAPGDTGVAYGASVGGLTYNTNLVRADEVPRRLDDVLLPRWKGIIASTPYAFGMRELAMPDMLGRDWAVDYTTRLARQVGGVMRCGDEARVGSGEFAIFVMSCGQENVIPLQQTGAPMAFTTLADGAAMLTYYGAVPKHSSAPNTAALLVAYLESPEGQQALWDVAYRDLWVYPESHSRPAIDTIKASGGKLATSSPQWLASITGFTEMQNELEKILQQTGQ
jgi:ABC-type Fe3+ transport system substrate-binding protein